MPFNSYEFIFGFYPFVIVLFYILAARSKSISMLWLSIASLFFYGWWEPRSLVVICVSMTVNYFVAYRLICRARTSMQKPAFIMGIAFNLGLLSYYKYWNFLLSMIPFLSYSTLDVAISALPLGISFFTFVQIAFLADAYRKEVTNYTLNEYVLFVTYFPHLIAGPIIHHSDVIPEFRKGSVLRFDVSNFSVGVFLFALGLFKKTLLADHIANLVPPVFNASSSGGPTFFEAWCGVLAYTLQIYFDFSGYSDMALGLSKSLGIALPANFYSPYKARSIIEFWRRWHMSLSRFLRDYLYVPLGGNRLGSTRRYINLMLTMVIGGLWHGAGWNFIIWGFLHGTYLIINHGWRKLGRSLPGIVSHILTLTAVMVAWVFFRASNLTSALEIIRGMVGLNGISIHASLLEKIPALRELGIIGKGFFPAVTVFRGEGLMWLAALSIIVLYLPNSLEIIRRFTPASGISNFYSKNNKFWDWQPNTAWAFATAALFVAGLVHINKASIFLYFQF